MIEIKHGNRLVVRTEPDGEWIEVGRVEILATRQDEVTAVQVIWTRPACELVLLLGKAYALWYRS